jgi:hypothetical protein
MDEQFIPQKKHKQSNPIYEVYNAYDTHIPIQKRSVWEQDKLITPSVELYTEDESAS